MKRTTAEDFLSIVDYASTYLYTMEDKPVNEVDLAIFSKLSYFSYSIFLKTPKDKIKIKDLYDLSKFRDLLDRPAYQKNDRSLINAICGNPRYKEIYITGFARTFDIKKEEQFAAITLLLENGDIVVAFRGTDSSINGWKEDFNMAYKTPIPAQTDSSRYLKEAAKLTKNKIYVVGHSKGGNLALYSYITSDDKTKNKVKRIYSFDGPGILKEYYDKISNEQIILLYRKIVPNESIIGMIFDHDKRVKVTKSEGSLLSQHSLYRWHIKDNHFVNEHKLNPNIKKFDELFNEWITKCTIEERELIVETIFNIVNNVGIKSSVEIINNKSQSLKRVISGYMKLEKSKKEDFMTLCKSLVKTILSRKKED